MSEQRTYTEAELRVIDAIQSARDYLDDGDPCLALECLERIEPGDLSDKVWGSLKKAKEEVESGDPYIAGMVHLDDIASSVGYDFTDDEADQQLPESICTDGSIAVGPSVPLDIAEFSFNHQEAKGELRFERSTYGVDVFLNGKVMFKIDLFYFSPEFTQMADELEVVDFLNLIIYDPTEPDGETLADVRISESDIRLRALMDYKEEFSPRDNTATLVVAGLVPPQMVERAGEMLKEGKPEAQIVFELGKVYPRCDYSTLQTVLARAREAKKSEAVNA